MSFFTPMGMFVGGAVPRLDISKLFATELYTGPAAGTRLNVDCGFPPDMFFAKNRTSATAIVCIDRSLQEYSSLYSKTAWQTAGEMFYATGADSGDTAGSSNVRHYFRRNSRFFSVATYAGNGTTQVIPHGLIPSVSVGMVLVRRTDAPSTNGWLVRHRGMTTGNNATFSSANGQTATSNATIFGNNSAGVAPSSSGVTVGNNADVNASGGAYIMYVFAHDTATDAVIQCDGGNTTLPWTPQWVLFKDAGATGNWFIVDAVRGFAKGLSPNTTGAEATQTNLTVSGKTLTFSGLTTPIWVAIRAVGG